MSTAFLAFNQKLSQLITNTHDRRCVASAVVAQYVADSLVLSSGEVDNAQEYYDFNVKTHVFDLLGPINEKVTLDVKLTQDYIRKYWMLRYNTVYPINALKRKFAANYGYFDTVMGVGVYIDEEHHAFVNQYKMEILDLYITLTEALASVPALER